MSPVDSDNTSYFFTSLADSVPLPAPGFPNMSMRNTLPPPLPGVSLVTAPARTLWRENGRALLAAAADRNGRLHAHTCFGRARVLRRPGNGLTDMHTGDGYKGLRSEMRVRRRWLRAFLF